MFQMVKDRDYDDEEEETVDEDDEEGIHSIETASEMQRVPDSLSALWQEPHEVHYLDSETAMQMLTACLNLLLVP